MSFKNAGRIGLFTIFITLTLASCKSTVNQITISTCKAVETNISKCSQLIADEISDKNENTLSAVNEGDL